VAVTVPRVVCVAPRNLNTVMVAEDADVVDVHVPLIETLDGVGFEVIRGGAVQSRFGPVLPSGAVPDWLFMILLH